MPARLCPCEACQAARVTVKPRHHHDGAERFTALTLNATGLSTWWRCTVCDEIVHRRDVGAVGIS